MTRVYTLGGVSPELAEELLKEGEWLMVFETHGCQSMLASAGHPNESKICFVTRMK